MDQNQAQIVKRFKEWGWACQSLAAIGDGCPDLLVAQGSKMMLVEVKTGKEKPNPEQAKWHSRWPVTVAVVRTIEDVDYLASLAGKPAKISGNATSADNTVAPLTTTAD